MDSNIFSALCSVLQSEKEQISAFAILRIFQEQITNQKKKVKGMLNIIYKNEHLTVLS